MDPVLIDKLSRPLPRYTSYPTAPHFRADFGRTDYESWLGSIPPRSSLSLYVHIPFCDTLCWFCACSTKITRRYAPVARYLDCMQAEIERVSALVPERTRVDHIHWGGGSPDILRADDIARLAGLLRNRFDVAPDAEFAVEIDPRALNEERVAALVAAGLNRISLGVQDFDPAVQAAINRHQSIETTRSVVERFRMAGLTSVNIDLVYGLPYQTPRTARRTIDAVIALEPDRIALFGYAHLPQRVRHQRLISDASVPGVEDRLRLCRLMSESLTAAGYEHVGIDHFVKPDDAMAHKRLRRNFQGYTTDASDALLGFGASAISRLPQGYVQNAVPIGEYQRRIQSAGLASVRGVSLSLQDRARAFAIETLMCELRLPEQELRENFGEVGVRIANESNRLGEFADNGLIERAKGGFVVTKKGRPFLRAIAAEFDSYLGQSSATHSTGF